MPAGLEVYNDANNPQLVNAQGYNFVAITSGTVSVGSNTSIYGTSGFVSLPVVSRPYLVFIRCGGNAQAFGSTNSFSWRMAQGTTSFQYWVFGPPSAPGNVGMQVFNPDSSIQWDCTQRPMKIVGVVNKGGAMPPSVTQTSTANFLQGPGFGGLPTNAAFLMSDMGLMLDIYAYSGGGPTIRGNMRYYPYINTPDANTLFINYGRVRDNISGGGGNASYQSWNGQLPNYLLMCEIF